MPFFVIKYRQYWEFCFKTYNNRLLQTQFLATKQTRMLGEGILLNIFNFLLATDTSAEEETKAFNYGTFADTTWGGTINDFLKNHLVTITILLIVMAAIFCVVLGFLMMKTEKPETQETYKKRMIQICVTLGVCLILVWILKWVLNSPGFKSFIETIYNNISGAINSDQSSGTKTDTGSSGGTGTGGTGTGGSGGSSGGGSLKPNQDAMK